MKIKPCPFCGGNPSFKMDNNSIYRFHHTCKGINPQLNINSHGYKTKAEAIARWNIRYK